jgi:hypothetical protein
LLGQGPPGLYRLRGCWYQRWPGRIKRHGRAKIQSTVLASASKRQAREIGG